MTHPEILRQLIALRKARGLKQATIARRIHVTRPYVSMLENGRRALTVPMMIGYADAVGAEICVVDKGHQTCADGPVSVEHHPSNGHHSVGVMSANTRSHGMDHIQRRIDDHLAAADRLDEFGNHWWRVSKYAWLHAVSIHRRAAHELLTVLGPVLGQDRQRHFRGAMSALAELLAQHAPYLSKRSHLATELKRAGYAKAAGRVAAAEPGLFA